MYFNNTNFRSSHELTVLLPCALSCSVKEQINRCLWFFNQASSRVSPREGHLFYSLVVH